jgi:Tfp pilus assembly protein PilO
MQFRIKQQVLVLIAGAVLVIGFVVFRYLPLRKMRNALKKEQVSQTVLIERGRTKQAEISKLQEQLDKLNENLADFDSKIPPDTGLGQFLGRIAALMDEQDLTDQQIAPHDRIESGQLICTPITMKCSGRLKQIQKFCRLLQELDRTVRIEKFRLVNDDQYSGRLRMEAEAVIYHARPVSKG